MTITSKEVASTKDEKGVYWKLFTAGQFYLKLEPIFYKIFNPSEQFLILLYPQLLVDKKTQMYAHSYDRINGRITFTNPWAH